MTDMYNVVEVDLDHLFADYHHYMETELSDELRQLPPRSLSLLTDIEHQGCGDCSRDDDSINVEPTALCIEDLPSGRNTEVFINGVLVDRRYHNRAFASIDTRKGPRKAYERRCRPLCTTDQQESLLVKPSSVKHLDLIIRIALAKHDSSMYIATHWRRYSLTNQA